MQVPGIHGWIVFATGLIIVAYRVHGIDSPRAWIEWVERQFVRIIPLRFVGGILLFAALVLAYFAKLGTGLLGWLSLACIVLLAIVGLGLLLLQNHVRHIIFATAESSDATIRSVSIALVLLGLVMMVLPFITS